MSGISISKGIMNLTTLIQGAATGTLAMTLLLLSVVTGRTGDLIEGLSRDVSRSVVHC